MKTTIASLAIALGLVISALIISKPWVTIRHTKPIVVKGYAELTVSADAGSLSADVMATSTNNAEAYNQAGTRLDRAKELIRDILGENLELIELKTRSQNIMKLDKNGKRTNLIEFYNVTRSIRVNTTDVHALEALGRALYDLSAEGIRISVKGPEFFISDLNKTKLELVKRSTENGKQRAALMAQSSGEALGSLVSARQGVIQITKKNSSETSSWGIYDTETIEKVVKLVVTLGYEIAE